MICAIYPDAWMPTDQYGNVADIIKYDKTFISRKDPSFLDEQEISAACRDITKDIKAGYNNDNHDEWWNFIVNFYKVVSPMMYDICNLYYQDRADQVEHFKSILRNKLIVYIPPDSSHLTRVMFNELQEIYPRKISQVRYSTDGVTWNVTQNEVMVGVQSYLILERSEQHPMSCSSSATQHHGFPSGPNNAGRIGKGAKHQATRVFSEADVLFYAATMGPDVMGELLASANSPETHRGIIKAILMAEPNGRIIPPIIKPEENRAVKIVRHFFTCAGMEIKTNG